MMRQEFEKLTGFFPDEITYQIIEKEYYEYKGDKQQFCKAYAENTEGLAEQCQRKANEFHAKVIENYTSKIMGLEKRLENMGEKLEREEEWKPYGTASSMSTEEYAKLNSDRDSREMSTNELREVIEKECNFDYNNVRILHEIDTFEVNRHGRLRRVGKEVRKPIYNASDWNYIRFNSGMYQYEYVDGTLRFFKD